MKKQYRVHNQTWRASASLLLMLAALLTFTSNSFATTIAYWNFEDGVDGQAFNPVSQPNGSTGSVDTVNSVLMRGWDTNAGPSFTSSTYGTGLGMNNADNHQDGYVTEGALHNWGPTNWTVECMVYLEEMTGWETLIGRDGSTVGGAGSDFYLQNNGVNDQFRIDYLAADGTRRQLDGAYTVQLNKWYALAVVNDGTNLTMWLDDGAGYAQIGLLDMSAQTVEANALTNSALNWTFGRGWYNGGNVDHIDGKMDNIRFSDVALTSAELLTFPTNVFVFSGPTPASQTVAIGNPFSFSIVAGGEAPTYQWRHNGTPISGANSATYSVGTSVIGDLGNYDCVVTNNFSSVTSSVAVLSLHTPRFLTWGGVGATFDTTSANWTTNGGGSYLQFIETDHIRFDPLGVANPLVTLAAARQPSSVVVSNGSYTIAGSAINSSGSLSLENSASLVLSNANSFATGTTLSGNSTLHLRAANDLKALNVGSGSTVQLHGNSQTLASLAGAGTITTTNGTPVVTFGTNNLDATWSGTITNEGGAVSFIKTGTGTNTFSGASYLAGTAASQVNGGGLILDATSSIVPQGTAEFWVAQGATTGYVELNGGTLSVSNWLVVGRANAAANGTMVINSGTVTKSGGGNVVVGSLGATGTLIVNGGALLNNANLWLGENAGANGTLRLNGGLVQATQIRIQGGAPASSTAYFNGGILQPTAASADFIQSPTVGAISAGGLNFDNNGFDITIATLLAEDVVTPSTGGGLTKFGAGTLTLSGGYNYTGPTLVRAGTLSLNPSTISSSPAGDLTVTNATLAVVSGSASVPAANVTLDNSAVLNLNYGTLFANPTAAAIAATGNLTAPGSTVTINISANGLQVGTVPLITYAGTLTGFGNFVLGPLPPGVTASLANNPNSVDLVITATGQNLSWYGDVSNIWNIGGAANWANSLVPGATYLEYGPTGDPVRLDDTAIGNFNIDLPVSVHPFSVLANAANNYSITGAGGITGATSLVKSNTGTLFVGTANTYSGGTFVYGGSLAVSNNSALGNTANAVTLGGGNLQLENNADLAARQLAVTTASTIGVPAGTTAQIGTNITGAAALNKVDTGTLVLSGVGTFANPINVNLGTLNLTGTNVAAAPAMSVGSTLGGTATLNLPAGAALRRNNLLLGNATGAKGIVNMTNSSLVVGGGEVWIGGSANDIQTEGEFNLVGGSVTASNWTAIGRSFGTLGNSKGVLNIIGGSWTNVGANNFVVTSAANNNGTVNLSGGGFLVTGTGNQIWVGEGGNGVLNINGGTVLANRTANPALATGRAGSGAGSIRLNSGVLNSADQTWIGNNNSSASSSYGELNMTGGTMISRWYLVVGGQNDRGVYRQTGGACFVTNRFMTVAAAGGSVGLADLSGGSYTALDAAGDGGLYVAESGLGFVTIRGTADVSVTGSATAGGVRFCRTAGASGTLNLNGGTLTANRISKTIASSLANLNFNGGLLKARLSTPTFLQGLDNAYVQPGGANIDDGGFAITIGQALVAPTGNGVTAIAVATGGSGYIGAPLVIISGGTGTNCTAVANMNDDGSGNGTFSVGSITVTSPGVYTVDPTTVSFLGGGQNATAATAGAITTAANASGGLTKLGSGTVNLNGVNTYTGTTTVSAGTLGGTGTIAGVVNVAAGATLAPGNSVGTLTLGASPLLNAGSTIVAELSRTNAQTADRINVTGALAYNGTLILKNIGTPLQVGDTFTLFNASGYSGSFTLVSQTLGQVVTWDTSNLAVNGTVSVATVAPISMGSSVVGSTLTLTWPANQIGMRLETNSVSVVAPASWFTLPGSTAVNSVNLTIDPNQTNVFFRLVYP